MKIGNRLITSALTGFLALFGMGVVWAGGHAVNITPSVQEVEVRHEGQPVVIKRVQDRHHVLASPYNKTSRPCPPFCIQPQTIAPGVETIAELELLGYLKKIAAGTKSILVIDSRTRDWVARGTIPGSVNIPWNTINVDFVQGFDIATEAEEIDKIFESRFDVRSTETGWDFSEARTLVLFCNGAWCPQSSVNIKTLLKRGYPPGKIKWYRGGMQAWLGFGLTVVKPASR